MRAVGGCDTSFSQDDVFATILASLVLPALALAVPASAPKRGALHIEQNLLEKRAPIEITYDDAEYATTGNIYYSDGWKHIENAENSTLNKTLSYCEGAGEATIYLPGVGKVCLDCLIGLLPRRHHFRSSLK